MTAPRFATYPREPWRAHLSSLSWEQGDHILISAPTKAGKTTMVADLIHKRSHAVMFVSKLRDSTIEQRFKGWHRLYKWPKGGPPGYLNRILLWPQAGKTIADTSRIQRDVFAVALDAIFTEGNRAIIIDETLMFSDPQHIGLAAPLGMLHYYGRSSGISMLTLSQRPAWIPKVIYSSVTHAYISRTRDAQDARRLSDLGGVDTAELRSNLAALPTRHDYVYVNPQGDAKPAVLNTRR
jgi:hypothetical protein